MFQTEAAMNAQKGILYQVELILKKDVGITHRAFDQVLYDPNSRNGHVIGTRYDDSSHTDDVGTYQGQYFMPFQ